MITLLVLYHQSTINW